MNQLDAAFHSFVTVGTVLFCLGIALVTQVVRTIVEAVWKGAVVNDLWNEVIVRLGPILIGAVLVFTSKTFPWPAQVTGSHLALSFYGAACGVASAYVYAAFKAWLTVAATHGSTTAKRLLPRKFPKSVMHPDPSGT
jgi:hypothetical protein